MLFPILPSIPCLCSQSFVGFPFIVKFFKEKKCKLLNNVKSYVEFIPYR